MRKTKNIIIFLFLLFSLIGYGQKEVNPDFEETIFIEILPKIVDSMFVDIRPTPPPPKEIREEKDRKLKLKKWKEYKTNYLKTIPKYNTEFTIAIKEGIESWKNLSSSKIDFNYLKNNKKFIFKPRKEFPPNHLIWKETQKYSFAGIFSFSRIKFDSKNQNGTIYVNYRCGNLCGHGGIVYIKKELNSWVIEKIEIHDIS